MIIKILKSALLCLFTLGIFQSCKLTNQSQTLFKLIKSEDSGITFQNTLTEGPNTNILMYEYFYNGGGTATADFNGDDLIDIYFSSNMEINKLYLNKGSMKFEDITDISGVGGRPGPWKTGVNAVDINGDSKMDLYVCYSGAMPMMKRMNQLFINQGNDPNGRPIFVDKAAEYGVDSPAFSNQAYFFDYDIDGDLDMLLLNHNPKSLPVLNEQQTIEELKKDDQFIGLRLFNQNNGHFDDVTITSGISSSALSYGLGVGISDINLDGFPDFYVSNDYTIPDYLYINNKNGSFTNQLQQMMGHTSHFSMGNDIADINNDGHTDIYTLDMLPEDNKRQKLLIAPDNFAKFDLNLKSGFYYQYMRNMLQLNNKNGTFSEIGQLAGISNTDWSWSALFADFDLDGWKDLYVTNGYKRDYTNQDFIKFMQDYVKEKGRLQREDVLGIIEKMPASNVSNYVFKNNKDLTFTDFTENWGVSMPSNSNGASYADLDNDGDLDLVVNNVNQEAFIFQNQSIEKEAAEYLKIKLIGEGLNSEGIGAVIKVYSQGKLQLFEQSPARGYLSTISTIAHFGIPKDQNIDSVMVIWPNRMICKLTKVSKNQTIIIKQRDAVPTFEKQKDIIKNTVFSLAQSPIQPIIQYTSTNDFSVQPLLITEQSKKGKYSTAGDLDGDGLDEIITLGQTPQVYRCNTGIQAISSINLIDGQNYTDAAIFDANGDGKNDILLVAGGYDQSIKNFADKLYINNGSFIFTYLPKGLPILNFPKNRVIAQDVNNDKKQDLIIIGACKNGQYPLHNSHKVLINNGKSFTESSDQLSVELNNYALINDIVAVDLDADYENEILVVGEWMPLVILGKKSNNWTNQTSKYLESELNLFANSINVIDLNSDNKPDIVIGGQGLNHPYKASPKQPIKLTFADYDQNGKIDPIFSYFIKGKEYPSLTRDELFIQFAGFKKKFNTYESFSEALISDIFNNEELKKSKVYTVENQETILLLSDKTLKYKTSKLPIEAQFSVTKASISYDFDKDGKLDLVLLGNESKNKLRFGKNDANYGTLLKGDGKGNFLYVSQKQSGLNFPYDVQNAFVVKNQLIIKPSKGQLIGYNF